MATTHDATSLAQFQGGISYYEGAGRLGVIRFHVDMAAVAAALEATIDGSASDVIQMWDIPAGTHILSCMLYVIQAEGAAATVAVQDDSGGWISATTINTAGTMHGTDGSDTYGALNGKTYVAADTLDLLFATAADIDYAIFDVYVIAIFMDLANQYSTTWT